MNVFKQFTINLAAIFAFAGPCMSAVQGRGKVLVIASHTVERSRP
jgi:hypothetical protein